MAPNIFTDHAQVNADERDLELCFDDAQAAGGAGHSV